MTEGRQRRSCSNKPETRVPGGGRVPSRSAPGQDEFGRRPATDREGPGAGRYRRRPAASGDDGYAGAPARRGGRLGAILLLAFVLAPAGLAAAADAAPVVETRTVETEDEAGLVVNPATLSMNEGGTATYTVALRTRPTANVRITLLRTSDNIYFRSYTSFLTFTPLDWNTPQTVLLAAFQDDDAFDDTAAVTHFAYGGGYDDVQSVVLEIAISDDDEAGLALSPAALSINEGGTASYTIALRTRPRGNVRVDLRRSSSNISFEPHTSHLIFTRKNWNVPQSVTVSASQDDDALDGAETVTHEVSGGGYDGVPDVELNVTIDDDDEPGLVLSPAALTVEEDATATYTVALATRPAGDVRVDLQRSSSNISFSPHVSHLIFTPDNWNVPQSVTVSAPQDDDGLDGAETVTHEVSGGGYDGDSNVELNVTIDDDDEPGLVFGPAALTVDEGARATYTVALATRPAGDVRVDLRRSSYGIVFRPHVGHLIFTPDNWDVPQSVTVSAPQDDDTRHGAETVHHLVSGGGYDGDPNVELKVTITDDDEEPGLVLSQTALTVDEGATATYTVALATRPTGDVRVDLRHSSNSVHSRPFVDWLLFTRRDWNVPQTVPLTAPQDDDGLDGADTVTHEASGGGYDGVPDVELKVTIDDDDEPGLVLSQAALAMDEGAAATYTVALRTLPAEDVQIALVVSSDNIFFQPDVDRLTFTPDNWNVPQPVTVVAAQDDDKSDNAETVIHVVTSGNYVGETTVSLAVTIADTERPGLVLSQAALAVDEGAATTYTVALRVLPAGDVRVALAVSSDSVFFQPDVSQLTFTPDNWNVPQPVTVAAAQDDDTRHGAETVTHTMSGGGYDGTPSVAVKVRIADDDATALENLALEGIPFNEVFEPGRTSYTATVRHEVETVTIGAAAENDRATLRMPRDRDGDRPGVQVNLDEGENVLRVRVFARRAPYRTYTVTVTRMARVIAASLTDIPDMHVGRPFAVNLELSEYVAISYRDLRDRAFTVTGGRISAVRRLSTRRVIVDGESRFLGNRWRLSVRPDGDGPVTLSSPAARPCDEPGAICTPSGHRVGNALELTVQGPEGVSLSLHPPSGPTPESAGHMVFTLSLSRAIPRPVIFCWRTVEAAPPAPTDTCPWAATAAMPGSATARADYRPYSGFFLLDPHQTDQRLAVGLVDDSIDDNGETVTVEIAHARFLNSDGTPGVAVPIETSAAAGTIENRGAIPSAWLVRFGRTVAEQVVETVRERVSAPQRPGFAARLAGQAIGAPSLQARQPTPEEAVASTSLALSRRTAAPGGPSGGGLASLWLKGAASRFDGKESGVAVDGEVTSGLFGADYADERWSAGLVLSVSRGAGDYGGQSSGRAEASLTGLYPWGRHALGDRTTLWGVAGYGAGALKVTPDRGPAIRTDIDLALAALGIESTLLAPGPEGGPGLEAVSDLLGLRTTSRAAEGMAASQARATRLRAGLRGSWTYRDGDGEGGGTLTPSLEVGLRHDGGDAETGLGLELGTGLAFSDPTLGLSAELRARAVLGHADGAFEARGVSGALSWDPRPSSAIGPSLSLRPGLGASSPVATAGSFAVAAPGGPPLEPRLEAALGYGLPAFGGRLVGVPELGAGLSAGRKTVRLSWRLSPATRRSGSFDLLVEAARHMPSAGSPEHEVSVRIGARF